MATPKGCRSGGRFRNPVRHQPSGSLCTHQPHRFADQRTTGQSLLVGASLLRCRSRRPEFRAHTPYSEFVANATRSKTANVLFAVEFDRRHKSRGVRATAVHPGVIQTEASRFMTPGGVEEIDGFHQCRDAGRCCSVQMEDDPARGRDQLVGRASRGAGRPCGRQSSTKTVTSPRSVDDPATSAASRATMRSMRTRESAVGEERRDGGREVFVDGVSHAEMYSTLIFPWRASAHFTTSISSHTEVRAREVKGPRDNPFAMAQSTRDARFIFASEDASRTGSP